MDSITDGTNEPQLPIMDFPMDPSICNKAFRAAGFTSLSAEAIGASALIGDVLKKLGAVKIGRSGLLLADEKINIFIGRIEQILDQATLSEDMRLELIKVITHLIGRKIIANKAMINSAQIDLSDGAKMTSVIPSFLPKAKVVPFDASPVTIDAPPLSSDSGERASSESQSPQPHNDDSVNAATH
jgi:hypothetical protein